MKKAYLYQTTSDKTLRVMHGDKTIVFGEKSSAHQYKLKESVVKCGVIYNNAIVTVFNTSCDMAI